MSVASDFDLQSVCRRHVMLEIEVVEVRGRCPVHKVGDRKHTYAQCVDPWKPYTDGGTVVFRFERVAG
jgi:hypothetical protein